MFRYILPLLSILCCSYFPAQSQKIERVEPPFWWIGMNAPEVQLLVYGENISEYTPTIPAKELSLKKVHKAQSPNYLFLDVAVELKASASKVDIRFEKEGADDLVYTFELKERERDPSQINGFDNSDVMYLITPDRFANGDPSNDEVDGMREGLNRSLEYGRHGGDIKGISDHLDYINDLGFTAIWLNPVLENDQDEWSYHGYATTDYYKVDPRFGTNEEYKALSDKARSMGIGMIMDIIVNHCGSKHWWMEDPPFKNWINNFGNEYLGTNHRKETLMDPYASKTDRTIMTNGWFVPAMPDLNQRNEFMSKYLIQNSIWWIEYLGLEGIRQDTYSYPFKEFMTDWTCAIMDEYPNFNIVGEEWIEDPSVISYWQKDKNNADGNNSCLPSLMDFPLCFAVHKSLTEEESWNEGLIRLYQSLTKDFHYSDPNALVVFPDNHDMSRIFTQVNEDFTAYKMALGYILTTRGVPQLYYGTEILMSNPGTDSHGIIRSDFPGGWQGDSLNLFNPVNLKGDPAEAYAFCKKILNWRKNKKVIHEGKLMHFIPSEGVYVYFRYSKNDQVMVVMNKNEEPFDLKLDRFSERLEGVTQGRDVMSEKSFLLDDKLTLQSRGILILELE